MPGWFQALMPKEERFFDLFSAHAGMLVQGAEALRELLADGGDVTACCQRIVRHELEADEIARETLQAVRRTFITPFDRSDIRGLANSLDDAIDQMQKTAKTITLFEVASFEPGMKEMGGIIAVVAGRTLEAVDLLRQMRANASTLHAFAEEVTQFEEKADGVHDQGIKALFLHARETNDPMGFIVGREVYDHLEKVVDRFEDVANRISGILIEHL